MRKILFCSLFFFCISLSAHADKDIIKFLRTIKKAEFCGESYPLGNEIVRERLEKEVLLSLWDKAQVFLWLKRSSRYFPVIEKLLVSAGLPDDLKYISVIESALRFDARSGKGAAGFWQFIPATAKLYGLTVNNLVDERRDIERSTTAAIEYLSDLYKKFGTWKLALAAYNLGEIRIQKDLKSQKEKDYFSLWLPEETMRYLYKAFAVKFVFENRGKLGFYLKKADYYRPFDLKKILIHFDGTCPASLLSSVAGVSYHNFKIYNPWLIGDFFTKGKFQISLPLKKSRKKLLKKFKLEYLAWKKAHDEVTYIVKPGDSLIKISEEMGVRVKDVMEWNRLGYKNYIYPGQSLLIRTSKN